MEAAVGGPVLYRYDPNKGDLDAIAPVDAHAAGVLEKQIEQAVANTPAAIFRSSSAGSPILVVRTSVSGRKMPDIIALDSEGRLVLVECKREWADRNALSQLLDYAADYSRGPLDRLKADWKHGAGQGGGIDLLAAFRDFAEDPAFEPEAIAKDQVLVVLAAGRDDGFAKIATYLEGRGVPVYFVQVRLYRRGDGELYLDVEPVDLAPVGEALGTERDGGRAWLVNTDETHSPGAWQRFLERKVAAIWGYADGPKTLQQGAKPGDIIYAYLDGRGIVVRGVVVDGDVRKVADGASVFPECGNDNEWHLEVEWIPVPEGMPPVSNREVRQTTGVGLPVRNTFCRLWNPKVRDLLTSKWG